MKKSTFSIAFLVYSVLSVVGNPAMAGWFDNIPLLPTQTRETYKASNLEPIDVERFCQDRIGNMIYNGIGRPYKGAERNGDSIICYFEDIRSGSAAITHTGERTGLEQENDKYVNSRNYTTNDVCEYKHQGIGAFAGDGGSACYDSYRKYK